MNEATKTKALWGEREWTLLRGRGIDIGCGRDPVLPDVRPFDQQHGDANRISEFVSEQFDYVYSAHCLEHMRDPRAAILEWWKLVRPGGHLFVIVPDEDLYEQGYFPSLFNPDHKATFTVEKSSSWSPVSVNMTELARSLPGGELVDLRVQDHGYNHAWRTFRRGWRPLARPVSSLRWHLVSRCRRMGLPLEFNWFRAAFWSPIDQTVGAASAQIQLIVRKSPHAP